MEMAKRLDEAPSELDKVEIESEIKMMKSTVHHQIKAYIFEPAEMIDEYVQWISTSTLMTGEQQLAGLLVLSDFVIEMFDRFKTVSPADHGALRKYLTSNLDSPDLAEIGYTDAGKLGAKDALLIVLGNAEDQPDSIYWGSYLGQGASTERLSALHFSLLSYASSFFTLVANDLDIDTALMWAKLYPEA